MKHTIWKYVLQPEISIEMPKGAQVLSVREQGDDICLWALVDPSAEMETRSFVGFGTGHVIPNAEALRFVDTAHLNQGRLVFHVFEKVA